MCLIEALASKKTLNFLSEGLGHKISDKPLDEHTYAELIALGQKYLIQPGHVTDKDSHVLILDLDKWVTHWTKEFGIDDPKQLFTGEKKIGIQQSELERLGFKFLTHGTVYAIKKEAGKEVLVFSVQFHPLNRPKDSLSSLTVSEERDLEFLAVWLHQLKEQGRNVTTNRAHKGTGQGELLLVLFWAYLRGFLTLHCSR
jgi:hypothetical protein